jgi:hypothetical protein
MFKLWFATLAALAAQQSSEADVRYLKEKGISIQKPAKKDEWQFKDSGKLRASQIILAQVVDDISIEIYSEELDTDKINYDPKATLERDWKLRSSDGQYKEAKQVKKIEATNFPGRAASGVKVWLLDQTFKLQDGSAFEWKEYCFIGHENRSGYVVNVLSKGGMYAKHKEEIDLILSSIKTYKIPKK